MPEDDIIFAERAWRERFMIRSVPAMERTRLSRRGALLILGSAMMPWSVAAKDDQRLESARNVVSSVISQGNLLLSSGRDETQIVTDLEALLVSHADIPLIARHSLGRNWRFATDGQRRAFINAFSTYLAHKYVRYFPDFIGGRFEIVGARHADENYVEVLTHTLFDDGEVKSVRWFVLTRTDAAKVANFLFVGLNMLTLERRSIERMLSENGNDLDLLIDTLARRRS